ncbi:MAG: RtcB family protein [Anaerolineaceae bacterium]|nr:RtcB family protein [Anaerolineaceae bacterium]
MLTAKDFQKISNYEWEIPPRIREGMRVPIRIFATHQLLHAVLKDQSLEQAINVATLPGLVGDVVVMPDVHQGYGFPIGGVAATAYPEGIISPGGIGYDINCGVRLLGSSILAKHAAPHLNSLASALDHYCPSGVGKESLLKLQHSELDEVCDQGARWAMKKGWASEQDLRRTEDGGCLKGASPVKVSARAKERGRIQLGSLGSGNHFIEVGVVEQIFDQEAAQKMGLHVDCLTLMIHCGSRGFGHQICTDYVQEFQSVVRRYGISLPDRELVCAPLNSPEGAAYLGAMRAAANYAFANRQILAHQARKAVEEVLAGKVENWYFHQVYDVAHNIAKIETHTIKGRPQKLCVHRKGATRAFGPKSPELPPEYQASGQPVLVPGSMGTSSWVLMGAAGSMQKSFGSSCHGAGRMLSRSQAKKQIRGDQLRSELERKGIHIRAGSLPGLAEEAPQAYKDVDEVVEIVCEAGIAHKVVRLKPLAVIKG